MLGLFFLWGTEGDDMEKTSSWFRLLGGFGVAPQGG